MNALDFIPISAPRKAPTKAAYKKPNSIKQFEKEYQAFIYKGREKNYPPELQVKTSFRDDKANDLTKLVCAWLKVNGYFAARVNTTGTYSPKLGRFIKSGSTVGMSDITAVIAGKHVSIEIKAGRDRPRPDQLKVQQQIQSAGGVYIFVNSFDDFLEQINPLLTNN